MEFLVVTLLKAGVIAACLVIPDVFLRRVALKANYSLFRRGSFYLFIIALLISVSYDSVFSFKLLILINVFNVVWHLHARYFGEVIQPDSLFLLVKPDHFRDVVRVGASDVFLYARELLTLAAATLLSLLVLRMPAGPGMDAWGVALALMLLVGWGGRVAARPIKEKRGIHPSIPGPLGALAALSIAIKWWFSPIRTLPGSVAYSAIWQFRVG